MLKALLKSVVSAALGCLIAWAFISMLGITWWAGYYAGVIGGILAVKIGEA